MASSQPLTGLTPNTTYYFRAYITNSAGTFTGKIVSTTTLALTVPNAPVIGTATAGNAQASVTFSVPSYDGGSAITGYTATSSPNNHIGTGSTSPIIVTGLTNGTAYTFTVNSNKCHWNRFSFIGVKFYNASHGSGAPIIGTVNQEPDKHQ